MDGWMSSLLRKFRRLVLGTALVASVAGMAAATVREGDPAPDFHLRDVYDHWYRLSDYRGKVVLLDLAGYGCNRCVVAASAVEFLWQEYQRPEYQGKVQVLGLEMYDGNLPAVQLFIETTGVTFPVLRDAAYLMAPCTSPCQDSYGLEYDNFVVLDPQGIVRYTSENNSAAPLYGRFDSAAIRAAVAANLPTAVEARTWSVVKELFQ